jgi:predicted O-methyltransferase YrrM
MTVENPAARNEPAIAALVELYGRHGYEILTGMQAKFVGGKLTDSTYIVKNMATLTGHLGISLVEIYFLETLFFDYQPKNIFVVGNSFGWSSFALALLNRSSKIVAIEIGDEPFTKEWIGRTNDMAQQAGLAVKVVQGSSPEDTATIVRDHLGGRIDFAFVDGIHTSEAMKQDFAAIYPLLSDDGVVLFHDVVAFKMMPGLEYIRDNFAVGANVFYGTSSGAALVFKKPSASLARLCGSFGGNALAEAAVKAFCAA